MTMMVHLNPISRGMMRTAIVCIAFMIMPRRLNGFSPTSLLPSKHRNNRPQSTALSSSASTHDIIVIGGGSAGLTAAKFAANFGKSVCIVEAARPGGDCTWTGCVPSKTLLAAAKRAWTWRQMNEKYGNSNIDDVSLRKMLRGVKKQVDENRVRIYEEDDSPAVLQSLGIDLAQGRACFRDARTVDVTNEVDGTTFQLNAKYGILVATGATPRNFMFDIAGLDSTPFWTYENVWEEFFQSIEQNPQQNVKQKKVIVVGGGPIGCELSQAIGRLGCSVILVSSSDRLLPEAEVDASMELQRVLEKEGVAVICNQRVVSVTSSKSGVGTIRVSLDSQETILGDHILVATGRVPNTQSLGLDDIGVQINSDTNGIQVDDNLQTCVKGVYAAGDCTGDRQFTHYAGFQGAIAARNILLPLKDTGVLSEVPATTFTDPEVASFGLTEQAALAQFGDKGAVSISYRPLSKVDRAVCEGTDAHGFIKIIYQSKSKQILGATIMAPAAGEIISELAVAKDAKLSFDQLATVMHSYPSYSIALQQMAADVYYGKLKKNKVVYDILKKTGL
mmetsp:Transcript_24182/g.52149  ORF Transcript_24182/g.52149 Transcript_24182/m.52149 type:complete len:561 (-) Transcript_24182:75-1757(-)|eukprot:CAMPEP_0172317030 /NCGR_PEP_ID=MMETSP1058-20130122/30325_1 /TAXON_ID=83371 /ORGANISM="Detonula confervacea, Strain CCMP 353" /LENGTH=560 /DNA_ID=CAMNT_0013031485 /DNA_START=79 /DNA_END=1761 /DNA_ORIENTATION=+